MANTDRRVAVGSAIAARRKALGMTQRNLAEAVGATNHSYIWEIETGRVSVGFDTLCRIADALGVRVRDLVDC